MDPPDNKMPMKKERSAAEIRKSNKPLMEKRRRERINNCLDQLKAILMEVTKKESSYYSKLEKADILEMTVKYLKNVKRQQMAVAMAGDPSVISKYIAGFNECSSEVTKYLGNIEGLSTEVKTRVLGHLANCLQQNQSVSIAPNTTAPTGFQQLPQTLQGLPAGVQIPTATPLSTLPGTNNVCLVNPGNANPPVQTISAAPMQLLPAKLPNGEMVFLLTNPQNLQGSSTSGGVSVVSATTPGQCSSTITTQTLNQPQLQSPQLKTSPTSSISSSSSQDNRSFTSSPDNTHYNCDSPLNLDMKQVEENNNTILSARSPDGPSSPSFQPLTLAPFLKDSPPETHKENQMRVPPPAHSNPVPAHSKVFRQEGSSMSRSFARMKAEEDSLNNNVPLAHSTPPPPPPLHMQNMQSGSMWRPW